MNSFIAKKYCSVLFIISIVLFFETQIKSQNIVACTSEGDIYVFNPKTCSERLLCQVNYFTDIAFSNGVLYAINNDTIWSLDTETYSLSYIAKGPVPFDGLVGDENGQLYLGSSVNHNVFKYDIASNSFSILGDVGYNCQGDLAIMGNKLYFLGSNNNTLIKITLNPFSCSFIGNVNLGGYYLYGLAVVSEMNSDFLVVSVSTETENYLYRVDTSNASASFMCSVIQGSFNNQIYGLTSTNKFSDASFSETNMIYIPNIFSPNNDGNNDILYVRGENVKELTFSIYNRWGEKVFESHDINKGWDGTQNGKKCEAGVYVYRAEITFKDGKTIMKRGDVTLVR